MYNNNSSNNNIYILLTRKYAIRERVRVCECMRVFFFLFFLNHLIDLCELQFYNDTAYFLRKYYARLLYSFFPSSRGRRRRVLNNTACPRFEMEQYRKKRYL